MKPRSCRGGGLALALASLCPALLPGSASHAASAVSLDPVVVSALRVPREASTVTSWVTRLDPKQLEASGILQLRDALNASPGVISTSTGGETGALGSVFIRGTTTNDSQIVIDGMRLSDSSTPLGNVLSAARTTDIGRLEILRGPQGAIYGGESIGGVLWMETPRGSGDQNGSATVEAGSFHSISGRTRAGGEVGNMNYHVSGSYDQTRNDAPNQHFDQSAVALRVEGEVDPVWTIGTTLRANDSYYENLGNSDDRLDASLVTLYATGTFSDVWTGRFLAGHHQEFYDSDSSFGNYGSDLRDASISTDQEIKLSDDVRLFAGAYGHRSNYQNTIGADEQRDRFGIHSAIEWDATETLTTMAALRWEDYQAYGDELTWRLGAIQGLVPSTSIRGGIGTSFRSPTYLDLFGSSFGAGNPNLEAEHATGWDIGIAHKVFGHQFEAAWFENQIEDRIKSFPTPPVNLPGETRTQGTEFAVLGAAAEETVSYRVAWTWLHASLSDQPRNAATASLDWRATEKSRIGIGATHLASHSWGGDPIDAYTVARLYGSYQLTEQVKLHARIENAFDADYELSDFYGQSIKGTGRGIYAGITIDW